MKVDRQRTAPIPVEQGFSTTALLERILRLR